MSAPSTETEIALLKHSSDQMVERLARAEKLLSEHERKMNNAESWGRGVFWTMAAAMAIVTDLGRIRTLIKGFLGL